MSNYRPVFVNALIYSIVFLSGMWAGCFKGKVIICTCVTFDCSFYKLKSEIRKRNVLVCVMDLRCDVLWTFGNAATFAQLQTNRRCFLHSRMTTITLRRLVSPLKCV